jgi:hypothetical protein
MYLIRVMMYMFAQSRRRMSHEARCVLRKDEVRNKIAGAIAGQSQLILLSSSGATRTPIFLAKNQS